ncbi:hypothetical protein PVK63_03985 [Aliivibrio sp. S2TY2]|uniref:hypothetical protein n=1 Tax=unclassified Aliivibrio TaxID=2645654 RepID=UPI00237832AC|nr:MULTISPECIES: hypothetical protein [unclassified Aliivibrio]MDD9174020.1 hypothetical protein [Aliivibrio sp. S3TY1]MDD9191097.1 hypothetical protein [Aliivibrio sp. S2TY2]
MFESFKQHFDYVALIAFLVSILPILQYISERLYSGRYFKIRNIELLHSCMASPANIANRLVVEHLFYSIFKVKVKFDIIEVLLTQLNPSESIELFKDGKKYLEISSGRFDLKEKYRSKRKQKVERYSYQIKSLALYIITSVSSLTLILGVFDYFKVNELFEVHFITFNIVWMLFLLLVALILGAIAIIIMTRTVDIRAAIKLIDNQVTNRSKWYY